MPTDAAAAADDPIFSLPVEGEDWEEDGFGGVSEDWDEDDFGGVSAEGQSSTKAAVSGHDRGTADPMPIATSVDNPEEAPVLQLLSSSEELTSSASNKEETNASADIFLNDNSKGENAENNTNHNDYNTSVQMTESQSINDSAKPSPNIFSEKRRQRRERRQVEQPQQQQQLGQTRTDCTGILEMAKTVPKEVSPTANTPSQQLTRRQRMAERVARGKVTLKVKPKSIFQDDNVAPSPTHVSSPQTPDPHLLVTNSYEVELLIDNDEIQNAKDSSGIVIPSCLDTSSLLKNSSPSAHVDKNEARRQRRIIRNKSHDKEEKTTLELLVLAEAAIGSDDSDYLDIVVAEKEVIPTPCTGDTSYPTKTETRSKLTILPASPEMGTGDDDDDNDEDVDPIMANRISMALDDARAVREAKARAQIENSKLEQNNGEQIDNKDLFDVGYTSRDLINEEDARLIFPTQDAMNITLQERSSAPISIEAAWDIEQSAKLNNALDQIRAHNNRIVKTDDSKPLLQLETVVSDNDDKESLEAASSSKLSSQKERIEIYTSGEGFGVGDDSSVDSENCSTGSVVHEPDDDDELAVVYKELTKMDGANDENNDVSNDDISQELIDQKLVVDSPIFSVKMFEASKERVQRWVKNPDAVSDIDDDTDFYPTKMNGFVGENKERTVATIKIPPPPAEKLQKWLESKSFGSTPTVTKSDTMEVELSPPTPKPSTSRENEVSPYKINTPKSPAKKKPNTIIEELDLKSHKKMAEKIAIASSKAAKKFEEEYSHGNYEGQSAEYCRPADSPPTQSPSSPERNVLMPTVGELVGGAFSPWKIPDRVEDDSNISLNPPFSDTETFLNVTAAALRAINGSEQEKKKSQQNDDKFPEESFEVSIQIDESTYKDEEGVLTEVLQWLFDEVLPHSSSIAAAFSAFDLNISTSVQADRIRAIVNDDESFNTICQYVASAVMSQHGHKIVRHNESDEEKVGGIKPFLIPASIDCRPKAEVLATSFIAFLQQISNLAEKPLPWGENNPLLDSVMDNLSTNSRRGNKQRKTIQDLVFPDEERVIIIFQYLREVCGRYQTSAGRKREKGHNRSLSPEFTHGVTITAPSNVEMSCLTVRRSNQRKSISRSPTTLKNPLHKASLGKLNNLNLVFPKQSPSPFETSVWNDPSIILSILSFVGNPVTVCVVKRLNVFCNRVVSENEHVLMRDAVRLGGMSKYVRPSFWLWVTERCQPEAPIPLIPQRQGLHDSSKQKQEYQGRDFMILKDLGAAGKWHPIIERDVTRAFGNMPPHKTGARYRQDSIVRALVTFGKEELIRSSRSYQAKALDRLPERSQARHFKLSSRLDHRKDGHSDSSDGSLTPTDTVSDWGGISPVGSYTSEDHIAVTKEDPKVQIISFESLDSNSKSKLSTARSDISDPVLCGNALTSEMKVDLQNKLRSILHALASRHEGVGYCQGMDYIVAHLLRVLQDTILLRVIKSEDWHTMPNDMLRKRMSEINSNTEIVEEVVFHVMDTFFTTYSLQHMYWPELRCLKTCCRVFEILIRQKLPVLADHFEHHDLNVGLFALGWFQTLFLYLPSMPSATVCHMWDIWLVERSFKIFFRVGTAILFLSQPTLLNHDLEGMMTYLNTFPDATLLRADILIPCALQIKITNRMLVEIEMEASDFTPGPPLR